jgi:hypothetical protein
VLTEGLVTLIEPVEALQSFAEEVDVDEVVAEVPDEFVAALAVDLVDFAELPLAAEVEVAPVAMHAPSSAVAATLATPVSTRDRAAGLRRRGRGFVSLFMDPIFRVPGKPQPR